MTKAIIRQFSLVSRMNKEKATDNNKEITEIILLKMIMKESETREEGS